MEFFYVLIAIKVILLGAVYGRLDGGGIAKVSEWIERSLVMFFFVLACAPFAGLWALLAYAGVVGIATGHGQYFLSIAVKFIKAQGVDPFIKLFFGADPRTSIKFKKMSGAARISTITKYGKRKLYWRNVFGMFLTGTLVGLPAFIISMCFGQWWGSLFLLTGVVKALAYMTGFLFWKSTEPAEYINGGLRNIICLSVIAMVL